MKIDNYKSFINENMVNSLLPYLSDDKLKESIDIFEGIYYLTLPFLDKDYEVIFKTAYGRAVYLSINDYKEKNAKWIEFINGFPVSGYFIEISIKINRYDLVELSSIIDDEYGDFLEKVKIYKWEHNKSNINLYPEKNSRMFIDIELVYNK